MKKTNIGNLTQTDKNLYECFMRNFEAEKAAKVKLVTTHFEYKDHIEYSNEYYEVLLPAFQDQFKNEGREMQNDIGGAAYRQGNRYLYAFIRRTGRNRRLNPFFDVMIELETNSIVAIAGKKGRLVHDVKNEIEVKGDKILERENLKKFIFEWAEAKNLNFAPNFKW